MKSLMIAAAIALPMIAVAALADSGGHVQWTYGDTQSNSGERGANDKYSFGRNSLTARNNFAYHLAPEFPFPMETADGHVRWLGQAARPI
ncbi:MAG: hypothetical protein AB7O80_23925 [Acetobacteraceae bacterium]